MKPVRIAMQSIALTLALGGLSFLQNLAAQPCASLFSKALPVAEDINHAYNDFRAKAAGALLSKGVGEAAKVAFDFQEYVYKETKSFLNIGPIEMHYDMYSKAQYMGKLQGEGGGVIGGNRTFILVPALYDRTYITLKKTDGKAGATISACVKNVDGQTQNQKDKSIDKGENTVNKEVELVFYETGDKYITINVIKTDGLNDFGYKLIIRGEFNEEVLKQEANQGGKPKKGGKKN